MHFIYGIMGLLVGFILGCLTIKINNKKIYHKQSLQQNKLEKKTIEYNDKEIEINKYVNNNITLLNKIANDYQQLCQNIIKNCNVLLTNFNNDNKILDHNIPPKYTQIKTKNDNTHGITEVPRDYPENSN